MRAEVAKAEKPAIFCVIAHNKRLPISCGIREDIIVLSIE
jgi:hypothetical protein